MITIKLSFKQLQLLHQVHAHNQVTGGSPAWVELLQEHNADFTAIFGRLLQRGSKTYRLRFSSLQALAFMQIWVYHEPAAWKPGNVLILDMIAAIDKAHKNIKQLQHENH